METKRSLELARETIKFFENKIRATKWVYGSNRVNYYEDRIKAIKTLIKIIERLQSIKLPERRVVPEKMSEAINLTQYYEDIAYNEAWDDFNKAIFGESEKDGA